MPRRSGSAASPTSAPPTIGRGVQVVHEICEDAPDRAPRVVHDPCRTGVAVLDELTEPTDAETLPVRGLERGEERPGRCDRLQAAAVAAAADGSLGANLHVAELAGEARRAPVGPKSTWRVLRSGTIGPTVAPRGSAVTCSREEREETRVRI
jgi:hypothetical protein